MGTIRSRRVHIVRTALLAHPVVVIALIGLVSLPDVGANAAGSSPGPSSAPGRSIAVSVPSAPVPLGPGQVGAVRLRVVNPGDTPVRVTITGRGLTLGDEGKISVNDTPDPLWADKVAFPAGVHKIRANGYRDFSVKVHAPPSLIPDLYFLGFVVTPVPDPNSGVTVINQIGGYFTIDVPGPRDRRLAADLELPGFSILGLDVFAGRDLNGTLHVHNIGSSAVQFWGETDTTTTGGSPTQDRLPVSLAPAGHERTFLVVGKPAWPIGFVHMKVVVIYPTTTETTTTQIVLTRSVLVISPWVFVVLAILVLVFIYSRVRRARRRHLAAYASRARRRQSTATGRRPAHVRPSLFRSTFSRLAQGREA